MPNTLRAPAMALCLLAAAITSRADDAPTAAQAQRTILETHDLSGAPNQQVIVGTVTLPAGAAVGWHTHDGDETGYVISGHLVLKTRGKPDQALKAGDHFFNPRGAVHSLLAAPGTDGGTEVSNWIVDKGKPLAQMVK